ncbi:hypothetical protein METBIDRAFT_33106 [Metschnikowia bicuspidata var. bicuspidata NRRL YB-4993]|uniref:Derlin n=1 Tax=Metschnikowia bicuspidata var. bicuspidata NRRL YB-4993 TaxID=869754 RepID=A0A1A0H825_9ASCO|nr:hypothetical protein METBIDRAFT_33106 [Metschnikowia bicuspidata var. bicuspidata NRRL YB-4993]OBA20171.1 hypothetical protein METBIDRAFT_33106 [Metschnikowia bicuspidata var. bicuspidata NRRL YB-4993]
MDRLNPLAIPLLPVTKTWVCAIVAMAAATSMDMVSPTKLIFYPSKMLAEPWRLVTSFCFFGPIQFSLVQYIFIIARTNNALEERYMHRIEYLPQNWIRGLDNELRAELRDEFERRKSADFAYFVGRIAMSIVATILILSLRYDIAGNFYLLGPGLEKILLYILCRNTPADYIQIMGISIKAKYAPFLMQFLEFLFSNEFKLLSHMLRHNVLQALAVFLTSGIVQKTILVFTVGHLWWYIQFFYVEQVYDESATSKQREWARAHAAFRKNSIQWADLPNMYRYLITPPWYFPFVRILKRKQNANAERVARRGFSQVRDLAGGSNLENPAGASNPGNLAGTFNPENLPDLFEVVDGSETNVDGADRATGFSQGDSQQAEN